MIWPIGQRLVCIRDNWRHPQIAAITLPVRGRIYIVRENSVRPWCRIPYGVRLLEIVNPVLQYDDATAGEPAFDATFFRPVREGKTDIFFAHEILRKVTRKDRVRA